MKKRFVIVALLLLCAVLLSACGGGDQPAPTAAPTEVPAPKAFKVTFDLNYDGAPAAQVIDVQAENAAEQPDDPARTGYSFTGWYTDKAASAEADFEVAIVADTVYYAGWRKTAASVTFDPNYDGAEKSAVDVEIGAAVSTPVTPTREGFLFSGWFIDAEGANAYDFASPVQEDITLFAKWEKDSGNNFRVSFEWNIDGKGAYDTVTVKKLGFASAPALTLDGYYLEGWYTDAECTAKFDFTTRIRENITLYAHWLKVFVFEAEYTDLTGLEGMGYSGNASGIKMIEDGTARGASNDHYVGWLYNEGLTLTFNLVSSAAVSDAKLALSLSAEFYDITLTDSSFTVAVNGQPVAYSNIVFEGVTQADLPFRVYVLDSAVSLKEGANVITLSVTNSEKKTGTIYATAPMVDALYVYAASDVTWAEGFPMTDNVK